MDKSDVEPAKSLVIGGTGLVGGYIVDRLVRAAERPLLLSRSAPQRSDADWIRGDLRQPDQLDLPPFATLYCTANAALLADALPRLFNPGLSRVVVFSSTSVLTKLESEIESERETIRRLLAAEQQIAMLCEQQGIGWTILRPTLIYAEGRDRNITPLSRLIRRFGFMPLVGGGTGLRQPVHAEDLAIGAMAAARSPKARNRIYALPGGDTISYREMIGRIFDALRLPRRTVHVPTVLWRAGFALARPLFPGANVAMGIRMTKDMAFDAAPAIEDLDWHPRGFKPCFDDVAAALESDRSARNG
jgi:nucleoside-diphosphate-sugar epimerase